MGTITARKRKDGTVAFTAQIRVKRGGKIVHTEAETFEREPAARKWLELREKALAAPGGLEQARSGDPFVSEVIAQYQRESKRDHGKTKTQVLNAIKKSALGQMRCSEAGSRQIVAFAQGLGVKPQTVGNYISHLASVYAVARPAWGYPLDQQAMADARAVLEKLALTSRSQSRSRRPTLDEMDKVLEHFAVKRHKRDDTIPMVDITAFCIFSTRRIDEVCRITWGDLDEERSEVWVRDMKHPGEKVGNDVLVTLPPEALQIIQAQPKHKGEPRIFPYTSKSVSTAFTRATQRLGIEDLHLHDMRHEGISRLFEMGRTIPQAASVSGHRTWNSLKRYTHLRQSGDKYEGWPWLDRITRKPKLHLVA